MKVYLKHTLTIELYWDIKETELYLNNVEKSETGANDLDESHTKYNIEASWSPAPCSYLKSSMMMMLFIQEKNCLYVLWKKFKNEKALITQENIHWREFLKSSDVFNITSTK